METNAKTTTSPAFPKEAIGNCYPRCTESSPAEGKEVKVLGQAPARAQFSETKVRRQQSSFFSSLGKSERLGENDEGSRVFVHTMMQQLEEMSVSKQRITDEFRASQQLTAQALRRLDEECDRRQKLELRVVEAEAAQKILVRTLEMRNKDLEQLRLKLQLAEERAATVEQPTRFSEPHSNLIETKLHSVSEVPTLPSLLLDVQHDVRSLCKLLM
jgi:ATP-dependent Lon protease